MANPSNPSAASDIGPIPDANTQGGPPSMQGRDAGATSPREVRPDTAEPVLEPIEGPAAPAPPPLATGQPKDGPGNHKPAAPPRTPGEHWPAIDCSKPGQVVDAAITECMKTKYGATLVDDMEDAQILLSYVSRNGLQEERKVSDETIQTLIATRERLRSGVFDSQLEEAKFRKSYGIIAKAAAPVTVASLRDSLTTGRRRRWFLRLEPGERSIAEITCLRYRNYAMWVLLALLVSQIYWTVSSSVLNKADALILEINKAPTKQVHLAQEAARQSAIKAANQQNAVEPASPKPTSSQTNPPQASPLPTNPPPAIPNETKLDKTQPTSDELVSKLAELDANHVMLSGFMKPMAWIFFRRTLPAFDLSPHADKDKANQQNDGPANNPNDIFTPSVFQHKSVTIRAVAGQVIDVVQKWLLPLLYGALGAMVFVVRTLSVQARDRLFRKEALVSLVLRVYLGMISGLAIGWFWNQGPQTPGTAGPLSLTTLSPFALAFVAGYGVELFFTLLDKIISTFTNKP